jgi:hypothetical protein
MEARVGRIRNLLPNRESSAMLAPAELAVSINLYLVKRRTPTPLRRFTPQHVARFARAAESSALRLSTTFMLRDSSPKININPHSKTNPLKIWWASPRVSAGRNWGSWPYSQLRTGVVNR